MDRLHGHEKTIERSGRYHPVPFSSGSLGGKKDEFFAQVMESIKMLPQKRGVLLAFVNFPIIVKNSGLDFMIIDSEHGA